MRTPRRPGGEARPPVESGFSLVELLVATATLAVVLAAAYGWVWSLGSLTATTDDRVQATTIATAVTRSVSEDVGAAVAVATPAAGRDPAYALVTVHDAVDAAPEEVTMVWDPARRVVWRNASGTYVADHIRAFRIGYVLEDGHNVDGGAMTTADWRGVRAVSVSLMVEVGAARVSRAVLVGVGSL
jgi:prepilin-type N-terminal cleavage/methylation domain-containing protein